MAIAFSFSCVPSFSFPFSTHLMRQLTGTVRGQDTKSSDEGPKSGTNGKGAAGCGANLSPASQDHHSPLGVLQSILGAEFCSCKPFQLH